MELRVEEYQLPAELKFNFEELKMELSAKIQTYETMTYTEDQLQEAKKDRAYLNKLKKALNDERIRREREYMQPFDEFKAKINEIIKIIDKPVALIDSQVKNYEDKKKEEKQEKINAVFGAYDFPVWFTVDKIQDKSWLNAGTSMKQIDENISGWKNRLETELKTLSELPEFGFEAIEVYKKCLDLNTAIAEGRRLAEIQKRKEEAQKAEEIPDTTLKVVKETPEDSGKVWISFRANLNMTEAGMLRDFFVSNGIEFEAI